MKSLGLAGFCLFFSLGAVADGLPDIIEQLRGGIVGVGTAYPPRQPLPRGKTRVTFRGTGFVVGDGLLIATNEHVLPAEIDETNNEQLAVFAGHGPTSEMRVARIHALDEDHDLVLLQIQGTPLPPLQLGDSESVREGQGVAFTGFPIGVVLGLYPVTHRGIVAAITPMVSPVEKARTLTAAQVRRARNPFKAFQLDATAYPGNSGSPVYEPETGRVIGVLNSVLVKETRETLLQAPSGISYAIPVRFLHELLRNPGTYPP